MERYLHAFNAKNLSTWFNPLVYTHAGRADYIINRQYAFGRMNNVLLFLMSLRRITHAFRGCKKRKEFAIVIFSVDSSGSDESSSYISSRYHAAWNVFYDVVQPTEARKVT